jgi:hypothetical protein
VERPRVAILGQGTHGLEIREERNLSAGSPADDGCGIRRGLKPGEAGIPVDQILSNYYLAAR